MWISFQNTNELLNLFIKKPVVQNQRFCFVIIGSGVMHSEYNASQTEDLNLFQIWIFTDRKGHQPRYDQKKFDECECKNKWQLLVSPDSSDDSLWIYQNAFISMIEYDQFNPTAYILKEEGNGVYFMLVDGEAEIAGNNLKKCDAVGVWDFSGEL